MDEIRPFRNADLPDLADVWIQHWSLALSKPPAVSVAMMEQAVLGRTFFKADDLLVARRGGKTVGWCHVIVAPEYQHAVIPAICFSPEGLALCDRMLHEAEARVRTLGRSTVEIGPLRDSHCGYAGLEPVGHGIGVSTHDARTASLLSRQGYSVERSTERLITATSTYRPPVHREWMMLRRTTRQTRELKMPSEARSASAMAHFDIEHHQLVDHRTGAELACVDLWTSDPEAQVMSCSEAIFDLGELRHHGELTTEQAFLISNVIQSLANRRVFSVQTAVDSDRGELLEQLAAIGMKSGEQGRRWAKSFVT